MKRADDRRRIVVSAAVIERGGEYLVTRRPKGVHLEGMWEFPGGKCTAGETLEACLVREIREELGAEIQVLEELFSTTHTYIERVLELHFFACALCTEPESLMGQELRWVPAPQLSDLQFPPADDELIARLTTRTAGS